MYLVQVGAGWIPLRDFLESLQEQGAQNSAPDVINVSPPPLPPQFANEQAEGWMNYRDQIPQGTLAPRPNYLGKWLWPVISLIAVSTSVMLYFQAPMEVKESASESGKEVEDGKSQEINQADMKPSGNDKLDLQQALQLWEGDGTEETAPEAVEVFRRLAETGDVSAQFYYGFALHSGRGVEKDVNAGVSWLKKAAAKNQSNAQFILACACYTGEGIARDNVKAVEWLTKSSMLGNSRAQYVLSLALIEGDGTPKDPLKGAAWMMLSAKSGWPQAEEVMAEFKKTISRSDYAKVSRMASDIQSQMLSGENLPFDPALLQNFVGQGTGFFVTSDGYLATNHHVIDKANLVKVKTKKGLKNARIVLTDPSNDLAILKVDGTFTPLPIQGNDGVALGSSVSTVGFPTVTLMGFSPKYAKGEITSVAGIRDDQRQYQISVPVQPGNSGGALVNSKGNVVGVVSAKLDMSAMLQESSQLPENVNYAMKSSLLVALLKKIPDAAAKLVMAEQTEKTPDEVVRRMEGSSVLILVK